MALKNNHVGDTITPTTGTLNVVGTIQQNGTPVSTGSVSSTDTTNYAITAVNQGTKTFSIAGNHAAQFSSGSNWYNLPFRITGATGNNGVYTVVSASFSTTTDIIVNESIPSATADGAITSLYGNLSASSGRLQYTSTNSDVWSVSVAPDGTMVFTNDIQDGSLGLPPTLVLPPVGSGKSAYFGVNIVMGQNNATLQSADASSGAASTLAIKSGHGGATNSGAAISVTSGAGGTTSGGSGGINIKSGTVTDGTTGTILLQTPNTATTTAANRTAGDIQLQTGAPTGTGSYGAIGLNVGGSFGNGVTITGLATLPGSFWSYKGRADKSYQFSTQSTGFSYTIPDNVCTVLMDGAGTLASGTITMPANVTDGSLVYVSSTVTITSLTVSANTGQTINNAPTTMSAGLGFGYIFRASGNNWYRLY